MANAEACRSRLQSGGDPAQRAFSVRRPTVHPMRTTLKELASVRELSGLNVHAARAASPF